jgi:hypothetical protein
MSVLCAGLSARPSLVNAVTMLYSHTLGCKLDTNGIPGSEDSPQVTCPGTVTAL